MKNKRFKDFGIVTTFSVIGVTIIFLVHYYMTKLAIWFFATTTGVDLSNHFCVVFMFIVAFNAFVTLWYSIQEEHK